MFESRGSCASGADTRMVACLVDVGHVRSGRHPDGRAILVRRHISHVIRWTNLGTPFEIAIRRPVGRQAGHLQAKRLVYGATDVGIEERFWQERDGAMLERPLL